MLEDADNLLARQRSRAYLGNILFRLCGTAHEVSGLKAYQLKENAIAKMHSLGMTVIHNDVYRSIVNPE